MRQDPREGQAREHERVLRGDWVEDLVRGPDERHRRGSCTEARPLWTGQIRRPKLRRSDHLYLPDYEMRARMEGLPCECSRDFQHGNVPGQSSEQMSEPLLYLQVVYLCHGMSGESQYVHFIRY